MMLILWLTGCSNERGEFVKNNESIASDSLTLDGLTIRVHRLLTCTYPGGNPLYGEGKTQKLWLVDASVSNNGAGMANRNVLIPTGAMMYDEEGNVYRSHPIIIAMSESSDCIPPADLRQYNAIWDGKLDAGESKRAVVLGFDLPVHAIPVKLSWNRQFEQRGLFITLAKQSAHP